MSIDGPSSLGEWLSFYEAEGRNFMNPSPLLAFNSVLAYKRPKDGSTRELLQQHLDTFAENSMRARATTLRRSSEFKSICYGNACAGLLPMGKVIGKYGGAVLFRAEAAKSFGLSEMGTPAAIEGVLDEILEFVSDKINKTPVDVLKDQVKTVFKHALKEVKHRLKEKLKEFWDEEGRDIFISELGQDLGEEVAEEIVEEFIHLLPGIGSLYSSRRGYSKAKKKLSSIIDTLTTKATVFHKEVLVTAVVEKLMADITTSRTRIDKTSPPKDYDLVDITPAMAEKKEKQPIIMVKEITFSKSSPTINTPAAARVYERGPRQNATAALPSTPRVTLKAAPITLVHTKPQRANPAIACLNAVASVLRGVVDIIITIIGYALAAILIYVSHIFLFISCSTLLPTYSRAVHMTVILVFDALLCRIFYPKALTKYLFTPITVLLRVVVSLIQIGAKILIATAKIVLIAFLVFTMDLLLSSICSAISPCFPTILYVSSIVVLDAFTIRMLYRKFFSKSASENGNLGNRPAD